MADRLGSAIAPQDAKNSLHLLERRHEATALLHEDPYNPLRHLQRGWVHSDLGFPDLAAADAYRALTLFETVIDQDSSEYQARKKICKLLSSSPLSFNSPEDEECFESSLKIGEQDERSDYFEPLRPDEYVENIGQVYSLLVRSLVQCGCMRDAYEFYMQASSMNLFPGIGERSCIDEVLEEQLELIRASFLQRHGGLRNLGPAGLDAQGLARRVLYPWNTHEPERADGNTLQFLNGRLRDVAPKCEVRFVTLPVLHIISRPGNEKRKDVDNKISTGQGVSIQLGLFAKEYIAPGETFLRESSLLTATNRLHDRLCDACNTPLPDLASIQPPVACEGCVDTIFCSQKCHDLAQEVYHGAVCGREGLEVIGKDIPDLKDKADYLYLLLLARAIAMSATQKIHPLDLPEVKYIWGDFHPFSDAPSSSCSSSPAASSLPCSNPLNGCVPSSSPSPSAALPFSFHLNILQPMRILEEMGIDPFASLHLYDTWILNTLYAKFRGTASGRLSTWDGGPEVCAVHPLWCLANHSCDPNVRWEWGGEITFVARSEEERVKWGAGGKRSGEMKDGEEEEGGIRPGEEILNHYCDIGLGVKERREWAMGVLGGACQCARCVWEAAQGT
jgi:hypothetical protein